MNKLESIIVQLEDSREEFQNNLNVEKKNFSRFIEKAEAYQLLDLNFYSDAYKKVMYFSKQINEIDIKIRLLKALT